MRFLNANYLSAIDVVGPDAQDWLNRILSQKVEPEMNSVEGAAYLDYRGRAQGIYWFRKIEKDSYRLYFEKDLLDDQHQKLDMSIFAEEIELKKVEEPTGYFGFDVQEGCIQILFKETLNDELQFTEWSEFEAFQIISGLLSLKNMESRVLIESSVYLQFIHDDKGCYPGQEVINKILSIGQVPKVYISYATSEEVSVGDVVSFEEQSVGKIECTGKWQDNNIFGLFVRKKLADELPESFNATLNDDITIQMIRLN